MADNTNNEADVSNEADVRAKLSEAEKIFVPEDLDKTRTITDFTEYKAKFFRTVPENCVLVKKSRIRQKIRIAGGSFNFEIPFIGKIFRINRNKIGLKVTLPFLTTGILVSQVDRTIDYQVFDCKTADGINASIDIAVVVRISDPLKYMNGGKEQLKHLHSKIQELLKNYAAQKEFEDLEHDSIDISAFDPDGHLEHFNNLYGISVKGIINKSVKLPENLQKIYDNKVEEMKKREAQEERLKALIEKAEAEGKVSKMKSGVDIENLIKLVNALLEQGVPMEEITKYLNIKTASDKGNAVFMNGDSASSNVAMGVAAGSAFTQRVNSGAQQNNLSNSQRLMKSIEQYLNMGINLNQGAMNLYQNLQTDQNLRETIDNFTAEDYKRIEEAAFKDMDFSSDMDEGRNGARTRGR